MSSSDAKTAHQAYVALAEAQQKFGNRLLGPVNGASPPPYADLFQALVAGLAANPERVHALQRRYYAELLDLWQQVGGAREERAGDALERDRRFSAPEWRTLAWFDYLRRSYALTARWLNELIEAAAVDDKTHRKLRFHARQLIDAMAPSNYAATNPEAIRLAFESDGSSMAHGFENLLADVAKGRISMTDESAFEVGRNLALTPGAVVYENDLMQLLQYRPLTEKVQRLPLVIVPPAINKYYVLDLQPENSFVRHALSQGLTVFMMSWRNIGAAMAGATWDDYLQAGVMRALEVAREICAVPKVNALGFCVGGTMLACALAVLRGKRRRPVASLTLLASMLDFSDTGDISVYIDEQYVDTVERSLGTRGILPGSQLASAFASLRANDLVWNYVVNNYLKGRTPPAFDLLHWNSDSANLPGPMYAYYLRNMYLENKLRVPGALTMCGVPIDLGKIALPSYVLATAEDHIVPWTSAFASARLLDGPSVDFILGASGHIAGVINPAGKDRRSFRTGPMAESAERWLAGSQEHPGSWWKHWTPWIKDRSGTEVPARIKLGSPNLPEIEPAPGRYVREQPAGAEYS